MKKYKVNVILNIILSIIIVLLSIHIYQTEKSQTVLNVYQYKVDGVPTQDSDVMQLCIVNKENIEEAINSLAFYRQVFYLQADKETLEPLLLKENHNLCWREIKTNDLANYDIEGYFAYIQNKEITLVPHYVKKGYRVDLKTEFNNEDMLPFTIGYLDDYMDFYFQEPLAKQRYIGFISDEQMFAYVEMKYHNVLEVKDKYSNMYACYVRTMKKNNALESLDLSATGTYQQWSEKYPRDNADNDHIDLYDYWSYLTRVDLGGKVKMRKHQESISNDYQHAYNFSSKAKTFAGVIQVQENDLKDKTCKLDATVTWNFAQESFTLKFEL